MTGNVFAAIGLPDVVRHELAAALDAASTGRRMPGKVVPPENWHITIRFIGDVDAPVIDRFTHALSEAIDARPGHVRCLGLGAFPALRDARVLFGGIDDPEGVLETLARQAETAALTAGLEPEERPYRPHLTLSRLRPKRDVRAFARSFGDYSTRIPVEEITIYRSERSESGLRHIELDRVPIRHRRPA